MTLLTTLSAAVLLPAIVLSTVQVDRDEVVPAAGPEPTASAAATGPAGSGLGVSPVDRPSTGSSIPATGPPPAVGPPAAEFPPPPVGRWSWPLAPVSRVVRGFRVGPSPWSPGHRGVDLAARAGGGAEIRAPANGIVRFAGVVAGRPVLSIDHGRGLISSFEPVISGLHRGQLVQQDDVVGRLSAGPTHCSPASCLHWGVRRNGQYIDPLLLVPGGRGPPVLLPLLPSS